MATPSAMAAAGAFAPAATIAEALRVYMSHHIS